MKFLTIILSIIFISTNVYSQKHKIKKLKTQKLEYRDFLFQYGKDETAVAIIDVYFDKKNNNGIGKLSFLPVSTSVTFIAPPIGIPLIAISIPVAMSGLITLSRYNNQNLLKDLYYYNKTSMIPKRLKRKVYHILREQVVRNNEIERETQANTERLCEKYAF